jgi:lysyl-tRNA synthetase class I
MKAIYRNKRDFYREQAEVNLRRAEEAEQAMQRILEEKKKSDGQKPAPKKDEYYPVTIYCKNCKHVSNYRVRKGIPVDQAGCIVCNMKGENILFPVVSYPGKWYVDAL